MPSFDFIEINPTLPSKYSVIWLHGLGADGHDFASIVPELKLPDSLPIRFIFPHAPMRPVTINNNMIMRAWYDILSFDSRMSEDDEGIRASAQKLGSLIDAEHSRGIPYENIFLGGFSQGGAMALFCGLRFPQKLGGIIGLSTYLPLAVTLGQEASTANKPTPILMAHGDFDMIVPIALGRASKAFLTGQNYQVSWHTYPMDHSVCLEEIRDISQWIQQLTSCSQPV